MAWGTETVRQTDRGALFGFTMSHISDISDSSWSYSQTFKIMLNFFTEEQKSGKTGHGGWQTRKSLSLVFFSCDLKIFNS